MSNDCKKRAISYVLIGLYGASVYSAKSDADKIEKINEGYDGLVSIMAASSSSSDYTVINLNPYAVTDNQYFNVAADMFLHHEVKKDVDI